LKRGGGSALRGCSLALWPSLAALLLAACAQAPRRPPPAPVPVTPAPPANLAATPEPVPRAEPRSASGNPPFYDVAGHRYVVLASAAGYRERGVASWYGPDFHGLRTATGERYDMFAVTAAHKTLPIPCYARVTNLSNGRSVVVRINDRGPFVGNRIIDLSYTAALKLDMIRNGTAFVEVETLTPASPGVPTALPVTTLAASAASVGVSNVPPVSSPPEGASSAGETPGEPPAVAPTTASTAAPAAAAAQVSMPPASAVSAVAGRFYIQVGAFSQPENARRAVQKLREAGLDHVFTLAPAADQPLQRVRIGPISSVQEFDTLIARLSTLGYPGARLAQD
jgi:rare lipoprotein A